MVTSVKQRKPQVKWAGISLAIGFAMSHVASAEINFNRDIRPILSDNCFFCHGPDSEERKADLRLDVEEGAKVDLGGYRAVDSENPEESELLARILTEDPDDLMPPPDSGKTLEANEIALLQEWLEAGAPYETHWAYQIPKRNPIRPSKFGMGAELDRRVHAPENDRSRSRPIP